MKCIIFGSAPIENYNFLWNYIEKDDFIMCADGGINHTNKIGISPDIVIGDFDSCIEEVTIKNTVRYPSEKDDTDMALCVKYAMEHGYNEIVIAGGLGGRIDHTLANISLVANYSEKNITLINEKTEITAISKPCILKKNDKKYVSFISFTEKCEGVTYKGLKYSLSDATLYANNAQFSISNEFTAETAEVSIKSGILLCVRTND